MWRLGQLENRCNVGSRPSAVRSWRREHGPDGQANVISAHTPGLAQVLDDAQAAPADRRRRRMSGMRDRRAAAVAHGDLDRTRVDVPGDLQPFAGQRICVQYRVAQEFANDQNGIGDRVVEYSGRPQFIGECLARESYARRGTRQVDDTRLPHLPDRPPRQSAAHFARAARVPMPELTVPETDWKRGDGHNSPSNTAARVAANGALPSQQGIAVG
jgi:hypothetical protein